MSARAICGMAKVSLKLNETAKAIDLYEKAVQANPDYTEAYRELVEIFQELGPEDKLLKYAFRINELSPDNPKYTLILAKAYLESSQFGESEQFFKRTIRLSPKLAEAYKGLGKLNMMQDDYQSAMKNFHKALDLDRGDVSILNSLGMAYVRLDRYREGIEKYLAALKFSPHDSRILFNLGYAKEKIGDEEQARFYYQQALDHKPDFEKALRRLEAIKEKPKKAS